MFILEKGHHYVRECVLTEVAEGFNRTSRTKLHRTSTQGRKHRLSSRMSTEDFLNKMPGSVGGKVWNRKASSPGRRDTHCSLGWRKTFQSGQNLSTCLLNDIQFATINGLSRSTGPKRGRAYHGNVTEHGLHGEQSEVEGTHVCGTNMLNRQKLNADSED